MSGVWQSVYARLLAVRKAAILAFSLFCALATDAQSIKKTPRKMSRKDKPVCSPGAICFSGKVSEGEVFRKTLNSELDFVLEPGWGWTITIVTRRPEDGCAELASVVNPPYRGHRDLNLDTSYGVTAEEEVSNSPREFGFVTNCNDFRVEDERLMIVLGYTATPQKADEALEKLGTSALGKGRLWITDSRISHARDTPDEKRGKIESMSFTVEVRLPRQ
jgi:hypothetical protein